MARQRKNKFRGKVKWNGNHFFSGEWVYGSYRYDEIKETHYIWVYEEDKYGNVIRNEEVEVIEETVGQNTGLANKTVEIYEGDQLGHVNNVVEFSLGEFSTNGDRRVFTQLDLEVIGNIHDNPAEE